MSAGAGGPRDGVHPPRGPMKTGILLMNLGSPAAPEAGAVRRYLREFLTDPRVIDIPSIPRQLLVNGIIAPFRAPKSAA
ncbi:MAG: ferrochelatase, partial [Planctomycetota bacterium]